MTDALTQERRVDLALLAYDVLQAAATSPFAEANAAMQAELEVLSREDLIFVAKFVAWEATRVVLPRGQRAAFLRRLTERRLNVMFRVS